MYYKGQGVSQNYKQAVHWYKKSAKQGDASAQFKLGFMYNKGLGVSKDYKQAFYWFKKSAEQGNAKAQFFLGGMYYEGLGVSQNFIYAYLWWNLASSSGDEKIINIREKLSIDMSSDQIATAQQLSTQKAKEIAQRQPSSK